MATITGTNGDDIDGNALQGTAGNDDYFGLGGRDYLLPTTGNDRLDGGTGPDVAIYDWAGFFTNGIFINNTDTAIGGVLARTVDKRGFGTDQLVGVENFHGTNFNDVIWVGSSTDGGTYTFDRDGNDVVVASQDPSNPFGHNFNAGRGNDSFTGTLTRFDRLDYFDPFTPATQGLSLAMTGAGSGTATDPWGFTDTFSGIETVIGTNLADTITMGSGDRDRVVGGAGNDTLDGGTGTRDVLDYREEFDRLGGFQGATVDLATGTATDSFGNTDTVSGFERVTGTRVADTLRGDDLENTLLGEEGDDVLIGRGGNDYFEPLQGNDTVDGGAGFDRVSYEFDADTTGTAGVTVDLAAQSATDGFGDTDTLINVENITGTRFEDILRGEGDRNQFEGLDGDDLLDGRGGDDDLSGGAGNDTLIGGEGGDFLQPGAGTDVIDGGANGATGGGDELSYGFDEDAATGITVTFSGETSGTVTDYAGDTDTFTGIERIRGTQFADGMTGAEGRQVFRGLAGNDTFDGGDGIDQLDYSRDQAALGAFQGVTLDMVAGTAIDGWGATETFVNIEDIRGSDFADTITGDAGDNDIFGEAGDDVIDGGLGRNYLQGWEGNDTITSRSRDDFIEAGSGNDTLIIMLGDNDDRPGVDPGLGSDTIVQMGGAEIRLSYASLDQAVTIDLALGATQKPFGDTDTFGVVHEVEGSRGNDTIRGSDREYEAFVAGAGNDTVDGRGGFDEVRFTNRDETGVTVDMTAGTATGSLGSVTFTGIESIQGSRTGADTVTGSAAAFEQFRMLGGDDIIDGGAGTDRVDYTSDRFFGGTSGVTVNLAAGFAIDGFGDRDTLLNIEQARGTIFDDELIGDGGDNRLSGDGGNDTVRGGGGTDVVVGNDGDDRLFGGDGQDFLNGGAGVDVMQGDGGPDVFRGIAADLAGDTIADYAAGDAIWVVGGDGGDGSPSIGADITTDGVLFYIDTTGDSAAEFTIVNGNGYLGPVASFAGPKGGAGPVAAVVSLDGAGGVAAQAVEGDTGTTALTLTFRRTGDTNATVTVDYAVTGAGAAAADTGDFTAGFGTGRVTFAPGQTERTVTLLVTGDSAIEPDELLQVTLTGVTGDGPVPATLGSASAFARIVNDDAQPTVDVQGGRAAESGGPLTFTVTRGPSDIGEALTVGYRLEPGGGLRGATSDDVEGSLPQSGTVTFAPGQTVALVTLGITDDTIPELHERVIIRLTGLSGPAAPSYAIGAGTAVGEIRNDDSGVPAVFPGSGLSTGSFLDPHLVTRDGLAYEFQAVGEFTLVEATAGTPLSVQVRYSPVPGSDIASQTTAIATTLGGVRVMVEAGSPAPVRLDGVAVDPLSLAGGLDVGDGQVFWDGEAVTVVYATGEQMRVDVFDGFLNVALALNPDRPTRGLLGDGDGSTANDLALPDGTVLAQPVAHADLYGAYADAWRVNDATSLFAYAPGTGTADFTDTGFPRAVLDLSDVPPALLARAEALAAGIADPVLRDAAIRDFLMSGNDDFFAAAAAVEADPVAELVPTGAPVAAGVGVVAADLSVVEGDTGATTLVFTLWRTGDTATPLDVAYRIAGASGALVIATATFAAGADTVAVTVDVLADRVPEADEDIVLTIDGVPSGVLRLSGQAATTVIDDDNAPVAGDDTAATVFGTPLVLTQAQLIANDSDADGDALTVTAVGDATGGSVALTAGGVAFTPDPGFSGQASFTYNVSDGTGGTDTATVTVTVAGPTNTPPIATDDTATTRPGTAVVISVLSNDGDADGGTLAVTFVAAPANGTFTTDGTAITYRPAPGFTGTDSFSYTVADGQGGADTAIVTVEVVNAGPVAGDDIASTDAGTPVRIDVLANDRDADGDLLVLGPVQMVTGGAVTRDGDAIVFTPSAGFTGTGGFDYTVSDGFGGTDTARVTVTVMAPDPVLRLGTQGNDRLTGTSADEIIDTLGGRIDVMAGGGGADIFRFSATANGLRETRTVLDFGGDDTLDLGTASVASWRDLGGDLYLYLDQDRDVVILKNVQGLDPDWFV